MLLVARLWPEMRRLRTFTETETEPTPPA